MPKQKRWLVILTFGCIALLVLFLSLPKNPSSALEKAVNPFTANPDSLKLMQAVELVNGPNPMEGINLLRELIEKDSNNVDAHYYLGLFSVKSGQIEKAEERFAKVLALRPDDIRYQVEVGYQYMVLQMPEKGLVCFERALQLDSTDNNSLFFSAQALEQLGRLAEAKRNYEQLLRHNTDEVVAEKVQEFIDNINKQLIP
ncbi:MAG TPA: tetratricopeptide repeat protein [Flavobacteriales bacterium]